MQNHKRKKVCFGSGTSNCGHEKFDFLLKILYNANVKVLLGLFKIILNKRRLNYGRSKFKNRNQKLVYGRL